ncbi:cadherin-like beta sandwich domain-containing protein [Paenibacillus sp. TRM 82003]|nr:cadherin-like beta sandwich domain-containing protein [Paenibacillus sp. TRM 82003]
MVLVLSLALPLHFLVPERRAEAAQSGTLPASCAAVKQANPGAPDGEYFISVSGKPVRLHCAGMNTAEPKEYLTLVNTGAGFNYSRYAQGGTSRTGTDVETRYTKVRFLPSTLEVDVADKTFSTSTGYISFTDGSGFIENLSFGTAADCKAIYSAAGTGNVNLVGTPFGVKPGEFVINGYLASGGAAYSDANQVVALTGGGFCGSTDTQDGKLKLELTAPAFDLSTSAAHSGQVQMEIMYPMGASTMKIVIPESESGTNEQSYAGGKFLIGGDWTVHAYYYDSASGLKSAVNTIKVGSAAPDLDTAVTTGSLAQGQTGAFLTIAVSNVGSAPTNGAPVTATASLPAGLTAKALSGTGWSCTLSTLQCSRTDALAAGAAYPPITVTVDVARDANTTLSVGASVAGGGEIGYWNNGETVGAAVAKSADLLLTMTHTGTLWQGKEAVAYELVVKNAGYAATSGQVVVSDLLPTGLTAVSMSGTGWSCSVDALECSRSDSLGATASYPPIALVVNVAANAPTGTLTNQATATLAGEWYTANNTAADAATVLGSNAYLSALSLSAGPGLESFAKTTTEYYVAVNASTADVALTPTAEQTGATIRYRIAGGTFADVASGHATASLPIAFGPNKIEVTVTAQNGVTTMNYVLTVYRAEADELFPTTVTVTPDGASVRIGFSQPLRFESVQTSKFTVQASGMPVTVASAVYDAADSSLLQLQLATPIAYGQTVTMSVYEGAVGSLTGNLVATHPPRSVANDAAYDEHRVVSALRMELKALDTAADGIRLDDVGVWLASNPGRDLTGDGVVSAADIRAVLRQLSPIFIVISWS